MQLSIKKILLCPAHTQGLAWNLLGIAVLTLWALVIGAILFIILRLLRLLHFRKDQRRAIVDEPVAIAQPATVVYPLGNRGTPVVYTDSPDYPKNVAGGPVYTNNGQPVIVDSRTAARAMSPDEPYIVERTERV